MQPKTQDELIRQLTRENLVFSRFTLVHEGNYALSDADWNYKDVPHLNHVHPLVTAYIAHVTEDSISTINAQKILGIKTPLAVFNYQSGPHQQTYYTTLLMFVLIIETSYQALPERRTRVSTRYAIGSSPWFQCLMPVIRWLLTRNYDSLMKDDIAMRERRGQLRDWGCAFKGDANGYGFASTMRIDENNVLFPETTQSRFGEAGIELNLSEAFNAASEAYVGQSDHQGLRFVKRPNGEIAIYPRVCPHEGACLDERPLSERQAVTCPWHGRVFTPLAVLEAWTGETQSVETSLYHIERRGQTVTLRPKPVRALSPLQPVSV